MAQLNVKKHLQSANAHSAYMYSFGAYKCHRKEFQCNCVPCIQVDPGRKASEIPPWWKESGERDLWPEKPSILNYKQVYSFRRDIAPWCCYVLVHENTVPASALTKADLPKFFSEDGKPGYTKVPNERILGSDYRRLMANNTDFLQLKDAISKALKCVTTVVPTATIKDHLAQIQGEIEQKIDEVTSTPSSGLTTDIVKFLMKQQTLEISQVIFSNQLSVDKEQRNTWCVGFLKTVLQSYGLTATCKHTQSEYSLFDKSLPDFLCVYGEHGKAICGLFAMEDDSDDDDIKSEDDDRGHDVDRDGGVHLLGSTTEVKMDGANERIWPQMFANMARIANLLVVRSLEFGYVVSSVCVYGLLARHETGICTPMLYLVNFIKNEADFYIGIDMDFSNCLALVSLKMKKSGDEWM